MQSHTDWFKIHDPKAKDPDEQVWAYIKETEKWVALPRPADLWVTVRDGTITVETDGSINPVTCYHREVTKQRMRHV